MNIIVVTILRAWVFTIWNLQQLFEILRRRREIYISISNFHVVHDENGLLVLDKPPDLLINSRNPWRNYVTLQMQLFFNLPHLANWKLEHMFHFVNRLDSPTSGLICVAYTSQMAGLAGKAFQDRNAKKCYIAAVWGHVDDSCCDSNAQKQLQRYFPLIRAEPNGKPLCSKVEDHTYSVEFSIGDIIFTWPNGHIQKIMAPGFVPGCWRPRSSLTKVTVLCHGHLDGRPASLLMLEPQTGRRHQLRLHCAIGLGGHPIAGDLIYSHISVRPDNDWMDAASRALPRMMLHAQSLRLELMPKPPYVKGLKKQERVNRSHPKPLCLFFESSRHLFEGCHWSEHVAFHQMQ